LEDSTSHPDKLPIYTSVGVTQEDVDVLYVFPLNKEALKQPVRGPNGEKLIGVPMGPLEPIPNTPLYTQSFSNISKRSLKLLTNLKWCDRQCFLDKLKELTVSTTNLVVPILDSNRMLRIKVIDSKDVSKLQWKIKQAEASQTIAPFQTIRLNSCRYWFGKETADLNHGDSYGTLVSCWGRHPLVTKLQLSYKVAHAVLGVFGNGYGSRTTSACGGLNMYFKNEGRDTSRPHPTPMMAENEVPLHQYFNSKMKNDFYNAVTRRYINEMAHNVLVCGKNSNDALMQLVADTCDRLILTMGHLPKKRGKKRRSTNNRSPLAPPDLHTFSIAPTFGFVNTSHVDSMDELTKDQKADWTNICRDRGWSFCEKLLQDPNFCLPTTCGYQFCFASDDIKSGLEIQAYFSMEGLGLAMQLDNGVYHHFMAAMFSHRTCLPVATKCAPSPTSPSFHKASLISCSNTDDEFLIVGWGNSGGKREVNAKKKKQKQNNSATTTTKNTKTKQTLPQQTPKARKKTYHLKRKLQRRKLRNKKPIST
jgi:hypothetical protein